MQVATRTNAGYHSWQRREGKRGTPGHAAAEEAGPGPPRGSTLADGPARMESRRAAAIRRSIVSAD